MLARFRADPKKVRVSIRRHESGWYAFVATRHNRSFVVRADDADAETAVARAVIGAARVELNGIDLGMEWTYEHPWKVG